MFKKVRPALILLALFSAAILGGELTGYLFKPREACAQCTQVPTGRAFVNGNEDSYPVGWAVATATTVDTCDNDRTAAYACAVTRTTSTCVDVQTITVPCGRTTCTTRQQRSITCRRHEIVGILRP